MITFNGKTIDIKNGSLIVGNNYFPIFQENHKNLVFELNRISDFIFDKPLNNEQGIYLFVVNKDFRFPVILFHFSSRNTAKLNKNSKIKPYSIVSLKKNQIFYVGSDNDVLTRARQHIVDKSNSNSSLKLSKCLRKWIKKYLTLYIIPYQCSNLKKSTKIEIESDIRSEYIPVYSNK